MTDEPTTTAAPRLRIGRKVGRTVYVQADSEPSDSDRLVGVLDDSLLAKAMVAAFNEQYDVKDRAYFLAEWL